MDSFKVLWNDIKYSFIDLFKDIHNFLSKFVDDTFLGMVVIALIAIAVVIIFTKFTSS